MIQRAFLVYDLSSGRVRASGTASARLIDLQIRPGCAVLEGATANGRTERIDVDANPPVTVPRPVLTFDKTTIAADDTDVAALAGLPDPCVVVIDGTAQTVTGGVLEIASPLSATYRVRISDEAAFPAQALDVEIVAT